MVARLAIEMIQLVTATATATAMAILTTTVTAITKLSLATLTAIQILAEDMTPKTLYHQENAASMVEVAIWNKRLATAMIQSVMLMAIPALTTMIAT